MFKHLDANCSSMGALVTFRSFPLNKEWGPCLRRAVPTPWSRSLGVAQGSEVMKGQESFISINKRNERKHVLAGCPDFSLINTLSHLIQAEMLLSAKKTPLTTVWRISNTLPHCSPPHTLLPSLKAFIFVWIMHLFVSLRVCYTEL